MNDANTIRTKSELHRHFFQAGVHLASKYKSSKLVDTIDQKNNFDGLTSIASLIFKHVIQRYVDLLSIVGN